MFNSVDSLRTEDQKAASQMVLRGCSREVREEPRYTGVQTNKQKVRQLNIKDCC